MGGGPIPGSAIKEHRAEVRLFGELVAGDEVEFVSRSYANLAAEWRGSSKLELQASVPGQPAQKIGRPTSTSVPHSASTKASYGGRRRRRTKCC